MATQCEPMRTWYPTFLKRVVKALAPAGDPAAVPDAVTPVLGVTHQDGMTVAQRVATVLDGRHRLLVFDNCEQPARSHRRADRGDPGPVGHRQDPRHQP